jgi:uncharacterized protein
MATPHQNQKDLIVRYGEWVVRWRWVIVLTCFAVAFSCAWGTQFLRFDTNYRVFFSKENPQLNAFDALEAIYTKNDNVLMVLEPENGRVFTSPFLAAVEDLTRQSWKIPYCLRVDSITNFQYSRAEGDDLIVGDLIQGAFSLTERELQEKQKIALAEPLLANRLISDRAHVTAVNVTLQIPEADQMGAPKVAEHVRRLAKELEKKYPHLRVHLTGVTMLSNAFSESGIRDIQTLVPIMYLVIFLCVGLLLRSFSGTFCTILVITMSIMTGMGLAGWLGIKLTPPSASAATMIMTLAVADSVHLLSTMLGLQRMGMEKPKAIIESLRINITPVFLTSLTTCIGFLSMNFSDAPPFRDLGNIVTMGIVGAFVFSVLFMPAFIVIIPSHARMGFVDRLIHLDRSADYVIDHHKKLLWGFSAFVLFLAFLIPRNELNDDFIRYFDTSTSFRKASDFTIENLTGIYYLEHNLGSGESGGISNPKYLEYLERFSSWYQSQPGVVHVNSLSDTMKRLNKNMHADDPAWYRLPQTRELAAQYLLLYEFSLPYGLDLNNQINIDKSATRFTVTMGDVSAKELRSTTKRAEQWLRTHAPEWMFGYGTGTSLMFAHISERNIKSMLWASALAFLLIAITLCFVFRSVKFGFLSLIPNIVPAIMGFGVWGITTGQVNLGLSVVTGMTLGIVVDDTIHFMSKYLRERHEQGLSIENAVRYAFSTVGPALLVTTIVLVAGFSVLMFSSFQINSGMGKLSALVIACALTADFILLPSLLIQVDSKTRTVAPKGVRDA